MRCAAFCQAQSWRGVSNTPRQLFDTRATVSHENGLGAIKVSTGLITIEDGASLMVDNSAYPSGEHIGFDKLPLAFGGFGTDGAEGVVNSKGAGALYNIFKTGTKTMTKDSLWNGVGGRIDIRSGTFDMGGHTFHTTNNVGMTGCTIANPGHIVVHKCSLSLESTPVFAGDASNTLSFETGSSVSTKNCNTPIKWTVQVNGDATFSSLGGGATTNGNCFAGPVVIAAGATFTKRVGTNTIAGPLIVGKYAVEGVPDGWHVTARPDTISFGAETGLIMVVR